MMITSGYTGFVLENGRLRLTSRSSAELGRYFVTEVRDGDQWRYASDTPCRPVDALRADNLDQDTDRMILAGNSLHLRWRSEIRPRASGFQVETLLTVRQPTTLNPSMILWIGSLDNMDDRQAHTWRQTVLRGPTVNQGGLAGNDLPACYLYDHANRLETICYFDPEMLGWVPGRLYELRAGEVFVYRPTPRYGLGLHPATPETTFALQPGEYRLVWWFTQRPRADIPSNWEAQRALVDAVTPLLDPVPTIMTDTPGWDQMANRTLLDLQDDACWINVAGYLSLRAYVKGSSALKRDEARGFELMTLLDVAWPLLLWRNATADPARRSLADQLYAKLYPNLQSFYRPAEQFITNGFPARAGDTFMDTWYFLENALIKWPWVAYLTQDVALRDMFFVALQGATQLAHNTNYLFPLFADASDWQPRNSLLNASVGGLYAAGHIIAHQLDADPVHLAEAKAALRTLRQLPPHQLTHEPQQLTFAAAAARYLRRIDPQWADTATDFIYLLLRIGYWGKDPVATFYDPRGMFQACASLAYPAYKENVESLIAWPELISDSIGPTSLMASFANLQRCHNYAFFDPWLPQSVRRGPCPYVPYEDLATAEFPHTAELGKELYGAGEVFWSALLFDTFGHADDPLILCLSLDVPCLELRSVFSATKPRFLLYNPTAEPRSFGLHLSTGESSPQTLDAHSFRLA